VLCDSVEFRIFMVLSSERNKLELLLLLVSKDSHHDRP